MSNDTVHLKEDHIPLAQFLAWVQAQGEHIAQLTVRVHNNEGEVSVSFGAIVRTGK